MVSKFTLNVLESDALSEISFWQQLIDSDLFLGFHYEYMPMQYTEIFKVVKNENFQLKNFDIFLIFAQNIDCGYKLEPPRRGGSNEYLQSMFWSKNKKNRYYPANPSFAIQNWGSRGYTLYGHVFLMSLFMHRI